MERGRKDKKWEKESGSQYLIRKVCAQRFPKLPDCLTGLDGGRVKKTPSTLHLLPFGNPMLALNWDINMQISNHNPTFVCFIVTHHHKSSHFFTFNFF